MSAVATSDTLAFVLSRLVRGDCPDSKWPDRRDDYWPLCPFHADTQSGSFAVGPRGFKCFACGESGSLSKLANRLSDNGYQMEPPAAQYVTPKKEPPLTVEGYARAKRLPVDQLRGWGLRDARSGIEIPYRDETGREIAVRRRYAMTGKRRFAWRKGDTPALYGLWKLDEFRPGGWLLLVEGESDCHTAWAAGLPALGVPGADNWRAAWAQALAKLTVYVWQEPDTGGAALVQSLAGLPDARVITPPLGVKDLSQAWLLNHDVAELVEGLRQTARPLASVSAPPSESRPCTDLGNAERLIDQHGAGLRSCEGRWLVWDGRRWCDDSTGEAQRRAVDTVRSMYREASTLVDAEARKALAGWARKSESRRRLGDMLELAKSLPGVPVRREELDAAPWSLNCANGTIDLRCGELRPHQAGDLLTRITPVSYDPAAWRPDAPSVWNSFLATVTGGDASLAAFLQRAAGYSLTGDTSEEVLFFVHGPAASGKSTFIDAVRAALGEYAATADFETFLARGVVGGVRNDIARLSGARFVASVEVDQGKRLAEGLLKTITGGDTVTARFLYQEAFEFAPQFKLWLVANDAPHVRDSDDAIWRRILRLPFEQVIPAGQRDPRVKATLRTDARAEVLAWAVQGCLAWQREGLRVPDVVTQATAAYRAEQDPLRDFLAECCVLAPHAWAATADLWDAYQEWGKGQYTVNKHDFYVRLGKLGCERKPDGYGTRRGWRGIGLLTSD